MFLPHNHQKKDKHQIFNHILHIKYASIDDPFLVGHESMCSTYKFPAPLQKRIYSPHMY